jgi:hypothetical protein
MSITMPRGWCLLRALQKVKQLGFFRYMLIPREVARESGMMSPTNPI